MLEVDGANGTGSRRLSGSLGEFAESANRPWHVASYASPSVLRHNRASEIGLYVDSVVLAAVGTLERYGWTLVSRSRIPSGDGKRVKTNSANNQLVVRDDVRCTHPRTYMGGQELHLLLNMRKAGQR